MLKRTRCGGCRCSSHYLSLKRKGSNNVQQSVWLYMVITSHRLAGDSSNQTWRMVSEWHHSRIIRKGGKHSNEPRDKLEAFPVFFLPNKATTATEHYGGKPAIWSHVWPQPLGVMGSWTRLTCQTWETCTAEMHLTIDGKKRHLFWCSLNSASADCRVSSAATADARKTVSVCCLPAILLTYKSIKHLRCKLFQYHIT